MTTVREIMTASADCVRTDQTAADAARMMTQLQVGSLPICGPDERLKGVVTDRDLVRKVLGAGREAGSFPAGDLNQDEAVTIGADDEAEQAVDTMISHRVRRLPVVDRERLLGMLTLADLARALPEAQTGRLVAVLSD
jgi:CBS domain-containing protein